MAEITVETNNGTAVAARYLTYYGAAVFGADGNQYVVAEDFSLEDFVKRYRRLGVQIVSGFRELFEFSSSVAIESFQMSVSQVLIRNFQRSGPDDLQRNYNRQQAYDGDGFVKAFTPAASFAFGAASAILTVSLLECEAGGAALNLKARFTPGDASRDILVRLKQYVELILAGGNRYIDITGFLGNNPNNTPNIEQGYRFVKKFNLDHY